MGTAFFNIFISDRFAHDDKLFIRVERCDGPLDIQFVDPFGAACIERNHKATPVVVIRSFGILVVRRLDGTNFDILDDGGGNDKAVESIAVDPAVTKITIGADVSYSASIDFYEPGSTTVNPTPSLSGSWYLLAKVGDNTYYAPVTASGSLTFNEQDLDLTSDVEFKFVNSDHPQSLIFGSVDGTSDLDGYILESTSPTAGNSSVPEPWR